MRLLLAILVLAGIAGGSAWLGHRSTRHDELPTLAPVPARPKALDDAWRAWLHPQHEGLESAIAALAALSAPSPLVRDEVELLTAFAHAQRADLAILVQRTGVTSSVVAAALRELARTATDPEEARRWSERLARAFPDSWAVEPSGAARGR